MCHVASLAVMYIGLGIIQLNTQMQDGFCVGLGIHFFLIKSNSSRFLLYFHCSKSGGRPFRLPLYVYVAQRDEFRHLVDFQVRHF